MSKWAKYKNDIVEEIPLSKSKWDKYSIAPIRNTQPEGDEWSDFIRKSFLKTTSEIPDIPANVLHLAERGGRKALGFFREQAGKPNNIDLGAENDFFSPENVDRPSKWIKAWADKFGIDITPRPSNSAQRIAGHAIDFAAPGAIFGLASKGAKINNALNATKTGALIGGTSGTLQEAGVDPLAADLASIVAAPYTAAKLNPNNLLTNLKNLPEAPARITNKIFGLSPRRLNVEAAQAARDLGIDLPAAALTDSKLTALADQLVGKTPYFGNKLQKKYIDSENQIKGVLNKIYDETGPVRTDELNSKIANLYEKADSLIPSEAKSKPIHLKKAIDSIEPKLKETAILSPDREKLGNILSKIKEEIEPTSKLVSEFGSIKLPIQDYEVKKLLGTKVNLNDIINWDEVRGVKGLAKDLQKATKKDLEEYGKTNPEWLASFKSADNLFGKAAKREKLEELLGKSTNNATDTLSYNALSKAINSKKTNLLIKKQVDSDTFEKIQKLGKVVKALAIKNRNIPNPSGSGIINAIGGVLSSYYYPPEVVGAVIGTAGLTKVLTDKKLLDLALKYAEKPTKVNSIAFNKHIKDLTGYSAIALSKELNRSKAKEENK